MLGAPDILILDEPTAGLDPKQIVEIRSLIRDFGKNRTVLISSHILAEIAEICERVLILRDGKLAGDCRMETLGDSRAGFGKLQIRVTGGKNECERMLRNVEGIKSFSFLRVVEHGTTDWELEFSREGTDMREALFDEIAKAKMKLLMSKPIEASIEDVFLQMTADERPSQATP
jgi:ABC-2 type transport system ATP-binding protein